MDGCDSESAIEVESVYLLKGLVDALDLSVGQVIHCSEADFLTECDEERYLIHKKCRTSGILPDGA